MEIPCDLRKLLSGSPTPCYCSLAVNMRRRGVGIAAVRNKELAGEKFKNKGTELAEDQLLQMSKQLEAFKSKLQDFASKHKADIKKDAEFRQHFQAMCATIGVDPLASSKGFWSEMLGVGDYYYELGVQIVEVALATSHKNGGIIGIEEMRRRVAKSRGAKLEDISIDDVVQAIKRLKVLGNGFSLIPAGNTYIIQSVPGELTHDHMTVIQHSQNTGYVTESSLVNDLSWDRHRAQLALEHMVRDGMVWVDEQADETQYWFPGLFASRNDS